MLFHKVMRFIQLAKSADAHDRFYLRQRLASMRIIGPILQFSKKVVARTTQRSASDYTRMQKQTYELYAGASSVVPGDIKVDLVVGSWKQHDEWKDYENYLMKYVPGNASWIALEYGCGPGRNIRRWSSSFSRIDGVDISEKNLADAGVFLKGQIPAEKFPRLFVTQGMDCGHAPKAFYDFAFSTICLQHICVHEVRFSILKSLFECLKPGGRISIQMGFGVPSPQTVGYFENFVEATETNRGCDVAINSPKELEDDFQKIGFVQFENWIRPVGPGDLHPNWIFATALKPLI